MFENPKIGKFPWEYTCGQQFEKLVVTNHFLKKKSLFPLIPTKTTSTFAIVGKLHVIGKIMKEFIIYSKAISCTKILRT